LYMAEVQAGNVQGAWLHGTIIYRLLQQQSQQGQVDITTLRSFLYNEAAACCIFLKQPILDYEKWIPTVFESAWAEGRQELSGLGIIFSTVLDPSIDDPFLKKEFVKQRQNLAVWQWASESADGLPPAVFTWWCSSHLVNHTRLLKYALDCADAANQNAGSLTRLFTKNAYLALAVVYWMRLIAGDETIFGVQIYQTKKPLLQLLRQLLEKEEESASAKYANTRLWALYFGAQAEHQIASGDPHNLVDGSWFSQEFAHQAARMNLSSWASIRLILDGFLECDIVEPHGSQFVPDLITPLKVED